jgi:hypothetical protein
VDIVWVVDNSGSMNREITEVGDKINSFAREVERSGLDYRVVFLTAGPGETNGVCVPEPLAGPRCQDTPRFRHVRQPVDSTNGLQLLLDRYGSFDLFLRPEATRHVVMVTDDDSNLPAPAYRAEAAARAPLLEHAIVHGVVGLSFRDCPDIARVGTVYQELAQATGGVVVPICCPDYDKLVLVLARDVVASLLRFTLAHPANPFSVAVALQDAQGGRAAVTDGWHYDVDTQSVLFAESFRPPTGAIVVVTYTTN